mgnify:CR=1 FL=1
MRDKKTVYEGQKDSLVIYNTKIGQAKYSIWNVLTQFKKVWKIGTELIFEIFLLNIDTIWIVI